jgi:hypothetical protein
MSSERTYLFLHYAHDSDSYDQNDLKSAGRQEDRAVWEDEDRSPDFLDRVVERLYMPFASGCS